MHACMTGHARIAFPSSSAHEAMAAKLQSYKKLEEGNQPQRNLSTASRPFYNHTSPAGSATGSAPYEQVSFKKRRRRKKRRKKEKSKKKEKSPSIYPVDRHPAIVKKLAKGTVRTGSLRDQQQQASEKGIPGCMHAKEELTTDYVAIQRSCLEIWRQTNGSRRLPRYLEASYQVGLEPRQVLRIPGELQKHARSAPNLKLHQVAYCKWGRYAGAREYIFCHRTYAQSTPLPPLSSPTWPRQHLETARPDARVFSRDTPQCNKNTSELPDSREVHIYICNIMCYTYIVRITKGQIEVFLLFADIHNPYEGNKLNSLNLKS